ncbi:MAG: flagellar basal-body rod protein FlgF [Brevinematia bacterium]
MVRGVYTGASGMIAQLDNINTIANNLANINTTSYKREISLFKAFPEMLARRVNDNGVVTFPLGSYDKAPVVGKFGTGVEINEIQTIFEQGSLRQTENHFDLALEGEGFFVVETPEGLKLTRNGAFKISNDNYLVTKEGFKVLGENGYIRVKIGNFKVDKQGNILIDMSHDPAILDDFVATDRSDIKDQEVVDRIMIVTVDFPRYLKKEGHSYYSTTELSGEMKSIEEDKRPKVHQGFLETSNVNPVVEMVKMISAERAYEANSKTIQTHDTLLGRAVNEVGKGLSA